MRGNLCSSDFRYRKSTDITHVYCRWSVLSGKFRLGRVNLSFDQGLQFHPSLFSLRYGGTSSLEVSVTRMLSRRVKTK